MLNKKRSLVQRALKRQKGVEPSSSAWKAEIMSRYMTAANDVNNLYKIQKKVNTSTNQNYKKTQKKNCVKMFASKEKVFPSISAPKKKFSQAK